MRRFTCVRRVLGSYSGNVWKPGKSLHAERFCTGTSSERNAQKSEFRKQDDYQLLNRFAAIISRTSKETSRIFSNRNIVLFSADRFDWIKMLTISYIILLYIEIEPSSHADQTTVVEFPNSLSAQIIDRLLENSNIIN